MAIGNDADVIVVGLDDTLFFAGEATDITGNTGTVHGAISCGQRATAEITKTSKG